MNDKEILRSYFSGKEYEQALKKYDQGIPAAYIAGEWEFFGDKYYIDENCLIPRCDTERVVEKVLSLMKSDSNIADLCTGSGCIIISALKRNKTSRGIAVDISKGALIIARKNAQANNVSDRIEFICGDIFKMTLPENKFDIIVSNPPYIPTKDLEELDEYVKKEPMSALDGGVDGTDFYRCIVSNYKNCLKDDGVFIFEIGYDLEEKIKGIAKEYRFDCTVTKDYSGNPRVAILSK